MSVQAFTPVTGNVPCDAHPEILMLIRYWQYIHPEGRLPSSAHFNLDDIPGLRPHMRLLDVVDGGPCRYRVRMIGEAHKQHLGYDPTGNWYETITPRFQNSIVELDLARVRHWMQPVYRRGKTIVAYASGTKAIERVHVPLASNGVDVDVIATLTLFFPAAQTRVAPWSVTINPDGADDSNLLAPATANEPQMKDRQMIAQAESPLASI